MGLFKKDRKEVSSRRVVNEELLGDIQFVEEVAETLGDDHEDFLREVGAIKLTLGDLAKAEYLQGNEHLNPLLRVASIFLNTVKPVMTTNKYNTVMEDRVKFIMRLYSENRISRRGRYSTENDNFRNEFILPFLNRFDAFRKQVEPEFKIGEFFLGFNSPVHEVDYTEGFFQEGFTVDGFLDFYDAYLSGAVESVDEMELKHFFRHIINIAAAINDIADVEDSIMGINGLNVSETPFDEKVLEYLTNTYNTPETDPQMELQEQIAARVKREIGESNTNPKDIQNLIDREQSECNTNPNGWAGASTDPSCILVEDPELTIDTNPKNLRELIAEEQAASNTRPYDLRDTGNIPRELNLSLRFEDFIDTTMKDFHQAFLGLRGELRELSRDYFKLHIFKLIALKTKWEQVLTEVSEEDVLAMADLYTRAFDRIVGEIKEELNSYKIESEKLANNKPDSDGPIQWGAVPFGDYFAPEDMTRKAEYLLDDIEVGDDGDGADVGYLGGAKMMPPGEEAALIGGMLADKILANPGMVFDNDGRFYDGGNEQPPIDNGAVVRHSSHKESASGGVDPTDLGFWLDDEPEILDPGSAVKESGVTVYRPVVIEEKPTDARVPAASDAKIYGGSEE